MFEVLEDAIGQDVQTVSTVLNVPERVFTTNSKEPSDGARRQPAIPSPPVDRYNDDDVALRFASHFFVGLFCHSSSLPIGGKVTNLRTHSIVAWSPTRCRAKDRLACRTLAARLGPTLGQRTTPRVARVCFFLRGSSLRNLYQSQDWNFVVAIVHQHVFALRMRLEIAAEATVVSTLQHRGNRSP